MAPPATPEWFPLRLELVTVSVAEESLPTKMPPPWPDAELPLMATLFSVRVPTSLMPPPMLLAPFAMVRPEMTTLRPT